jgi:hypothetical protein
MINHSNNLEKSPTAKKTKEGTLFWCDILPSRFRPASCEHAPRGFVLPPAPLPSGSPSIPASPPRSTSHPCAPLARSPVLAPPIEARTRGSTPGRADSSCAPLARSPVLAPSIEARTRGSTPGRADSATSPEPHPLPPAGAPAALHVRRCSHPPRIHVRPGSCH